MSDERLIDNMRKQLAFIKENRGMATELRVSPEQYLRLVDEIIAEKGAEYDAIVHRPDPVLGVVIRVILPSAEVITQQPG